MFFVHFLMIVCDIGVFVVVLLHELAMLALLFEHLKMFILSVLFLSLFLSFPCKGRSDVLERARSASHYYVAQELWGYLLLRFMKNKMAQVGIIKTMTLFSVFLYSYFIICQIIWMSALLSSLLLSSFINSFLFLQVTYTVGRDPLFVKDIVAESSPLFSAPVIVRTFRWLLRLFKVLMTKNISTFMVDS